MSDRTRVDATFILRAGTPDPWNGFFRRSSVFMMDRRTFLKLAAAGSLTFTAACGGQGEERLYTQVQSPEDMVAGKAHLYATTCRHCPAGCGLLAQNREGRVIKLEGNPLHPVNRGKLCIRGQSSLQSVYHPDRLSAPLLRREDGSRREMTFEEAIGLLKDRLDRAASQGKNRVRMLSGIEGESLLGLFTECLNKWRSPPPLVYEPVAYEDLKKANGIVFGVSGLPAYRLRERDFLLGFGADFLETWLSPVEYASGFKAMHAHDSGGGLFFHVGPVRSLTCANADEWLPCRPEARSALCLGLIREVLRERGAAGIPEAAARELREIAREYTPERVLQRTGLEKGRYRRLTEHLLSAESPLILGTEGVSLSQNDFRTDMAANLLNTLLDPGLAGLDFSRRHRVELASSRAEQKAFLEQVRQGPAEVLLVHQSDPAHSLPPDSGFRELMRRKDLFTVCLSNFLDQTASEADLVLPVALPLERWGEYSADGSILSTLQPAMASLHGAPSAGDVLIRAAGGEIASCRSSKEYLLRQADERHGIARERQWLRALQSGGVFSETANAGTEGEPPRIRPGFAKHFTRNSSSEGKEPSLDLVALPSLRFYDGRGAHLPWLCEIPDPITKVAWQSTLLIHPETAQRAGVEHGELVRVGTGSRSQRVTAYVTDSAVPGVLILYAGQGHTAYGRYAQGRGANPLRLLPEQPRPETGAGSWAVRDISLEGTGERPALAHTDGESDQLGRAIALTATPKELSEEEHSEEHGLAMHEFPLTLPLPSGYDSRRDFYPPHDHEDYRWAMAVDLDRCIGCNACAAACYVENNVGIVGEREVIRGREMSWLRIERYRQMNNPDKLIFLPMLCQHCDNAPCESVCPVYAPHHSKEGLNNQIYNRCIGTRFCAQNCPYKVRKFNWHEWAWPEPLNRQLNPDVTVRTKGVMEKCSFCVQRIKRAHTRANRESRMIRDGEVTPACVQTCPTDALVFGSLLDESSRVRALVADRRAYQVMGYLNTKPAVIYLKKVVRRS
ncbi:MAG: 4Fe-4S dicluster domain-containing protein [Desulfohalobiaceae bacterium]